MIEGIIYNIIFFGTMLGIVAYCFIRDEVLYHRYMKFYETTEEGRKLYCAQYELDRLRRKHGFIEKRMSELRDKINEYTTYMPDKNENREILQELKLQYHYNNEELKWTKEAMMDQEKLIDEMVAALPKKYRGIWEYDWRNAKVKVEEENVCW